MLKLNITLCRVTDLNTVRNSSFSYKKTILFYSFFLFSLFNSFFAAGQSGTTILYEDQFGQVILIYNGLVNGKHSYLATDGTKAVWSNTLNRWNLLYNNDTETLYYSNVATAMNPPNLSVGNWQIGPNSGTPLIKFQGTGTTTTVLPVELLHFNAITEGTKNLLSWATASENNNKGFDIEKSTDGIRFEKMGFVKGYGTTTKRQAYSFTDKKITAEFTYYRLKQLDFDGSFEYSKIIVVENKKSSSIINVYPNPSNDIFNIIAQEEDMETARLINSYGQTISIIIQNNQIDLSQQPTGMYYLQVAGQNIKLVKN